MLSSMTAGHTSYTPARRVIRLLIRRQWNHHRALKQQLYPLSSNNYLTTLAVLLRLAQGVVQGMEPGWVERLLLGLR